ncbi:hypothetical protein ACFYPZ_31515 [Streptomyces sp. NPDC005506]|uniref:LmrA/YxaF family transcription factor n=1 Tax=unclassified Streptomyces TaxID=2593676 RepID=UPI003684B454
MQHKLPTGRPARGRGPARRQRALAALFLRHGLPEERSRRPAAVIIAALEGVVIMCRVEQSTARWRRPPSKSMTCRPTRCGTAPIKVRHHCHDLPPPRPHPARRSDHAHSRPPGQRLRPRPRGR